jgi:hypothetical protein
VLFAKRFKGRATTAFTSEYWTYRWKGHVGPDYDYEKGCRPPEAKNGETFLWQRAKVI